MQVGDWAKAWELVCAARDVHALVPDTICFNSLISACDKGLQPAQAQVYMRIYIHTYIHAYIYMYVCVCV
jgi:hypothetical protein